MLRISFAIVPPGAHAGVDVRVVTKTQTGAFVEKANVVVKWTLVRGTGALKPGDDAPFDPKPRSSVYGLDPALLGITTTGPTPYTRTKSRKGEASGEKGEAQRNRRSNQGRGC